MMRTQHKAYFLPFLAGFTYLISVWFAAASGTEPQLGYWNYTESWFQTVTLQTASSKKDV